jgi:hypothetical protein
MFLALLAMAGAFAARAAEAAPAAPVAKALPPAPAADAPSSGQVMILFEVYRISGDISGDTSLTDGVFERVEQYTSSPAQSAAGSRVSFFTIADLKIAGLRFKADGTTWTWNGQPQPPKSDRVTVISRPRVMVAMPNTFEIMVGAQVPIQYFEPATTGTVKAREGGAEESETSGTFRLKTVYEDTGLKIKARVERGPSDRILLRDATFSFKTIEQRQPLLGVTLDVGRPIISASEFVTTIALKPGMEYGALYSAKTHGTLLFRIRLERPMKRP